MGLLSFLLGYGTGRREGERHARQRFLREQNGFYDGVDEAAAFEFCDDERSGSFDDDDHDHHDGDCEYD